MVLTIDPTSTQRNGSPSAPDDTGWYVQDMLGQNAGSVLIGLIITVVIFAALGATMLGLTTTSTIGQVEANSAMRAYLLAESGYRYAANEYRHAPDPTSKDDTLLAIHTQNTFVLAQNDGQFELQIFPYYFRTIGNPGGTQLLNTEVVGGIPADMSLSSGRLKIGNHYYDYTSVSQTGRFIDFNTVQTLPFLPSGTEVLTVGLSVNTDQTLVQDGDLNLATGGSQAWPLRNGAFQFENHTYAYRFNDRPNDRLTGIFDPATDTMASVVVGASEPLVLQKSIQLHSTGIYGQDIFPATRKIIYHVPLPPTPLTSKVVFHDTFEDASHWQTSTWGSHAIETIGGDNVLKVTGTQAVTDAPKASLIEFNWQSTPIDLSSAHSSAGFFLSYDAQVKVGFDDATFPDYGFDPIPIPKYYAAGLSFRLDNNLNSYGLSFLRGSNSLAPTPDNIDNGIVPIDQRSLIVLWQQINAGNDRDWLAYKDVTARTLFVDDIENGNPGWITAGPDGDLWNVTDQRANSPNNAWYYGRLGFWDYNVGQNTGWLISPSIAVCSATSATLSFYSWYETDPNPLIVNDVDQKFVEISTNSGASWAPLYQLTIPANPMSTWQEIQIDLSAFVGQTIQLRWRFDTVDGSANTFEGWYIDDIEIRGDFPVNEATLLVRLHEALSLEFNSGSSEPMQRGETVVGQVSNARGTIIDAPILSSGDWTSNNAAGVLLLNEVAGAFQVGESVSVLGGSATVDILALRSRDNYIRTYYALPLPCLPANSNPFDDQALGLPRGDVQWPPDEIADGSPTNDFFTQVRWDVINGSVASVALISSMDEAEAIVRSNEAELLTPSSGVFNQSELGLHTFGKGSTNVFFDDFALQIDERVIGGTTPPDPRISCHILVQRRLPRHGTFFKCV